MGTDWLCILSFLDVQVGLTAAGSSLGQVTRHLISELLLLQEDVEKDEGSAFFLCCHFRSRVKSEGLCPMSSSITFLGTVELLNFP